VTDEKKQPKEISFDLGFGSLFKGLGDLIDVLGEVAEKGQEIQRQGEFRVKGLDDQARGVYGFTVRTSIGGGAPRVERFGNIRATEDGPTVVETREPLVDVFDEEDEIVIVAELPGVSEEEIRVTVRDDILSLETTGSHRFAKEILLSAPVHANAMRKAYKNGILELRLAKA
jgi:HSP20 family protein